MHHNPKNQIQSRSTFVGTGPLLDLGTHGDGFNFAAATNPRVRFSSHTLLTAAYKYMEVF